MKILVSTSSFARFDAKPLERLREAGHDVRLNPHGRRLDRQETGALLVDVEGLIAGTETLDRSILEGASRLRAISRCGAGTDQIDFEATTELGIIVRRTADAHVEAVAELTLAGTLTALRRLSEADRSLRSGRWNKPMGRLLHRKTVGIVGLGKTGREFATLLEPFDVTILASDPRQDLAYAAAHGIRYATLEELLTASDVVSLHVEYSPDLRHLIGRREITAMKPSAVLVNCARGGLVDEDALADALAQGSIAAAHLDTFEQEPYSGPLTALDNTLLTPHIGSYAIEGRVAMERQAVENLMEALEESVR